MKNTTTSSIIIIILSPTCLHVCIQILLRNVYIYIGILNSNFILHNNNILFYFLLKECAFYLFLNLFYIFLSFTGYAERSSEPNVKIL